MQKRIEEINQVLKKQCMSFTISYEEVAKNNIIKPGIMIREEKAKVNPVVYLQPDELLSMSMDDTINLLVSIADDKESFMPMEDYMSKSYVIPNVIPKVIGLGNEEWVKRENYIYQHFLDMIILFIVPVKLSDDKEGSYTLKREHLATIGVTETDIFDAARSNLYPKITTRSLDMMLSDILGEDYTGASPCQMMVTTTLDGTYGAAAIILREVLLDLHALYDGPFYIFPSSIHEIITIPEGSGGDLPEYLDIVSDINATVVAEEDVLTDNVYISRNGFVESYR